MAVSVEFISALTIFSLYINFEQRITVLIKNLCTMAINYQEYEKQVYEWLTQKQLQILNFYFSTRQKASKGSERDFFIGTKKSGYFGTTFWWVPVSFPGSSSDLINVIFHTRGDNYFAYIQFVQTRDPYDKQNELALAFIKGLKDVFKNQGVDISVENGAEKKMEYYNIIIGHETNDINNFFHELDEKLTIIIPIVDSYLDQFKTAHITFEGRRIDEDQFRNVFQRRLNDRLAKYLPSTDQDVSDPEEPEGRSEELEKEPLNMIFYGPPGTGKTYKTIDKALQLADPEYYQESGADRKLIKTRFEELSFKDFDKESEAQIAFCTFHQSMSYEDFIEGIKPKTNDEGNIIYEIQDGIFKYMANEARKNYLASIEQNIGKVDFDSALGKLKEDWGKDNNMKFRMKMEGYEFTITEFTDYSIRFRNSSGGTSHTLSLATLQDIYYGYRFPKTKGVGIYYPGVVQKLLSYPQTNDKITRKNYVLIIDEINRGNVSQIFGELITCIEDTKRLGNQHDQAEVILPYSKTSFSVPPNLFLIGTMNTADRSVEALDTALRRRFVFHEINPQPELIQELFEKDFSNEILNNYELDWEDPKWKKIEAKYIDLISPESYERFRNAEDASKSVLEYTYSLPALLEQANIEVLTVRILETINKRIEVLLDRDHVIGHSYFIGIYTWDALKRTMFNKIVPLLQEYFYGDYVKIGHVLGEGFVKIKQDEGTKSVNFASFYNEDSSIHQKLVYELVQSGEKFDIKIAINNLLNTQSTV